MRLWSLRPRYLDARGLVAVRREGLLAQAVLAGTTSGYRRHPQLLRCRRQRAPLSFIARYLRGIHAESTVRGYRLVSGEQLKGKHLGVPDCHMTAAVRIRGILQDDYGVGPEEMRWVAGRVERVRLPPELAGRVENALPLSVSRPSAACMAGVARRPPYSWSSAPPQRSTKSPGQRDRNIQLSEHFKEAHEVGLAGAIGANQHARATEVR